jgi:transposase
LILLAARRIVRVMTTALDDSDLEPAIDGCADTSDAAAVDGRKWSKADRRALVDLASQPGMSVSEVAREFGILPTRLHSWRRAVAGGALGEAAQGPPVFAQVELLEPVIQHCAPDCAPAPMAGRISVDFPSGVQLRIDGSVDRAMLEVVLAELGR